jgi:putative protein kinase ArgK-like GTPase of G3E family
VKAIASEGKGIEELAAAIHDFEMYSKQENLALKRSTQNWQARLITMLRDALLRKAREQTSEAALAAYAAEIAEQKRDPYTLVDEIVSRIGN